MNSPDCLQRKATLKTDDLVPVFSIDHDGPYIEGWAYIVAKCEQPYHYRVRFAGEKQPKVRFINSDWVEHPASAFAVLVAFWRANNLSQTLEDFFPDSSPDRKG